MMRKVVFLDRDGTINVDHRYLSRVDQWQYTDGALPALHSLQSAGYALAIVTNQSGIARGYYTEADLHILHQHMHQTAAEYGVTFDAVAYCPHGPDDACLCRKPNTQMSQLVEEQLGCPIDYPNSWTIGDKPSDINFGKSLGTHTALITSNYWSPAELTQQPNIIAESLRQATTQLLGETPIATNREGIPT